MASSNREQSQSNMPKQHKIWQRRHRMPETPQPTCKNSEPEIPEIIFCKKILHCDHEREREREREAIGSTIYLKELWFYCDNRHRRIEFTMTR